MLIKVESCSVKVQSPIVANTFLFSGDEYFYCVYFSAKAYMNSDFCILVHIIITKLSNKDGFSREYLPNLNC